MTGPRVPLTVPGGSGDAPDYDEILDERTRAIRADLGRSFLAASRTTPDRHARVLDLSATTRLPADVVDRNLEKVQERYDARGARYAKIIRESPRVADWLRNPDNASVAHDDVDALASLEGQWRTIVHGWQAGKATNELADIGTRWAFGTPRPTDDARSRELRKQLALSQSSWGDEGVLTAAARAVMGVPGATAQQVPITGRTLAAGAAGAAAAVAGGKALDAIGTGAAAVVGGVLGGPGGSAAAAEAAGAVTGLKTAALAKGGWQLGVGVAAAQLEFGSAIGDYKDIRDANGLPLSREAIIGAAAITGTLNGLIESTTGLETLAKGVGAGALARMGRAEVKRALVSRTQGEVFRRLAAEIGRTVVEEGGTEYVQSLITSAMGGAAALLQDREAPSLSAVRDAVVQALQEGLAGAQGAVVLGGAGHVMQANEELRAAQRAGRQAEAFSKAVDAVTSSKLATRSPAKLAEVTEAVTKDTPAATLYFPVASWDTFFQTAGVADPGQAVAEITGDRDAYEEAVRTGGDIAIPAAAYLRAVATTKLSELHPRLQEEVRIGSPDAMNLRERRAYFATLDKQESAVSDEAAPVVAQESARERLAATTTQALVQSGRYRQREAETFGSLHASVLNALAERTGIPLEAVASRFPVTVEGPKGGTPIDVRTLPLEELASRAEAFKERQVERAAMAAPEADATESRGPYELKADQRDSEARSEAGRFVYARTRGDALRSNLGSVESEGLIDEVARLLQENELDSRDSLESVIPDENFHTFSDGRAYVGVKPAAAKARGRMAARAKSIAKLEAELTRREGDAWKERLWQRMAGAAAPTAVEDTSFDFAQPAYHGSPHVFDRFSLHAMGTGEGAQAYGWGLYFAGAKEVAAYYRDMLARGPQWRLDGKSLWDVLDEAPDDDYVTRQAIDEVIHLGVDGAIARLERYRPTGWEAVRDKIREMAPRLELKQGGRLYTVEIPEDDTMLLWDRPVSEQPAAVRDALTAAGVLNDDGSLGTVEGAKDDATGEDVYDALVQMWREGEGPEALTDLEAGSPPEAASRYLAALGVNGIKFLDQLSRDKGDGTYNYVIFDDKLIDIVEYEQRAGSAEGGVRGSIRFQRNAEGRPTAATIALAAKANLSTFLHEGGHLYLEMLFDLAADADAPESLKADAATMRKHLGIPEGARPTREQHEEAARLFEAYLMEGKAPSGALRAAFARFRAWLVGIYRDVRNLNVGLSPEVRRVFDRLVATEDEIAAAEQELQVAPLITDPAAVGLSEKAAAAFNEDVLAARRVAEEQLSAALIHDVTREQTAQYAAFREAVRAEVVAQVNNEPASVALSVLARGRMPDGTALEADSPLAGLKLSREGIIDVGGESSLAALRSRFVYSKEGGVHPDEVADVFGFASGAELVRALVEAEPTKARIDRITEERSRAEYEGGELLGSEAVTEEALKAVHNEKRGALLHRELEILAAQSPRAVTGMGAALIRKVPPLAALRAEAERIVAAKRVRDIRPVVYQRAETRAAREAAAAFAKGDFAASFEAKQRQVLNHELYRAASNARDEVEKIVDYARGFAKGTTRARIGKAGGDFLEQIDALLERYSFQRRSLAAVDRAKSLREWVDAQRAQGAEPAIDEAILDEARRAAYQDVPLEELRGVRDALKQIAHLARSEREALDEAAEQDMERREEEIVAGIGASYDLRRDPVDLTRPLSARLVAGMRRGIAELTRMEFLFRLLDGGAERRNGPAWRHLFKPMADAEARENELQRGNAEAIRAIFGRYTAAERRQWFKRMDVPEAASATRQGALTKANVLAMALNWGNEYNRAALLEGHGWTEAQVLAVLDRHMTEKDWQFVQALWDHLDTYWPAARDLERKIIGLSPDKVEAATVHTRFGAFKGGYYPISFDAELSTRHAAVAEDAALSEMFGSISARAMTRHGHLIQRTNTGGKPLRLDLGVIPEHLNQVIHDLAFRPAVIDVAKLVRRERVREAIEAAAGTEMYRQLGPWLKGIAGDRPMVNDGIVEKMAARARMGGTVVGLGLRLTSSLVQTLGYTLTVKELGPTYSAKGLAHFLGNPTRIKARWDFITERSPMMRDRMANYDRDVRDYARRPDAVSLPHSDAWFWFIGAMDLATSAATWQGAYAKAMDGHVGGVALGDERAAVDYADSVVRVTQAAGAAKDLAGVQRGTELRRLFTMFYSSLSIQFNQFYETTQQARLDRNIPRLAASLALVWLLPAVVEDVLRGRGPKDDDDDDSWLGWAAGKVVSYPFATVPVVRDLANATYNAVTRGRVDFSATPAAAAGESLVRAVYAAKQAVTPDEDVSRANAKGAADAVGYVLRVPSRQLWQTLEYFKEWYTGEVEPANPAVGLWQALVVGKPKD